MNQTATEISSSPFIRQDFHSEVQNRQSMLARFVSGIIEALRSPKFEDGSIYRHKSFIEENLLDKRVGPEIIRTLR